MIKRLTAAICLMARKEDKDLLDSIDAAIDAMNVETPNWRTELYNEYYGSPFKNNDFTAEEQEYPAALKSNGAVIRAVMNPEGTPYSWYDGEEAHGIAADIFAATADRFGLAYEIVPVATVVVGQYSAEIIQSNMETGTEENVVRYFYTHPEVFSKDGIPVADGLGCVVEGVSQIARAAFFHVSMMSVILTIASLGTRVALAYLLSATPLGGHGHLAQRPDRLGAGGRHRHRVLPQNQNGITKQPGGVPKGKPPGCFFISCVLCPVT